MWFDSLDIIELDEVKWNCKKVNIKKKFLLLIYIVFSLIGYFYVLMEIVNELMFYLDF